MTRFVSYPRPSRLLMVGFAALLLAPVAAEAACPPEPTRVVRSRGGVIDYLGDVPGIPFLCADGALRWLR